LPNAMELVPRQTTFALLDSDTDRHQFGTLVHTGSRPSSSARRPLERSVCDLFRPQPSRDRRPVGRARILRASRRQLRSVGVKARAHRLGSDRAAHGGAARSLEASGSGVGAEVTSRRRHARMLATPSALAPSFLVWVGLLRTRSRAASGSRCCLRHSRC
jgi:hypothetical protein